MLTTPASHARSLFGMRCHHPRCLFVYLCVYGTYGFAMTSVVQTYRTCKSHKTCKIRDIFHRWLDLCSRIKIRTTTLGKLFASVNGRLIIHIIERQNVIKNHTYSPKKGKAHSNFARMRADRLYFMFEYPSSRRDYLWSKRIFFCWRLVRVKTMYLSKLNSLFSRTVRLLQWKRQTRYQLRNFDIWSLTWF